MPPVIDLNRCNGCGICDEICPGDIIHMDTTTEKPLVRYPDECWYCGNCRDECPTEAISFAFPNIILKGTN